MEHTKHIVRAVLLLLLIVVVFVFARHFAIPETFGTYGHYRFANVMEQASKEPVLGAVGSCDDCHDEEAQTVSEGKHGSVSCESCHAPLSTHVEADQMVAAMPVVRSYSLCGWCHQRLVARPKEFPQVVFAEHVTEHGLELNETVCLECHDAHNPAE